jgi:hypothetical protein
MKIFIEQLSIVAFGLIMYYGNAKINKWHEHRLMNSEWNGKRWVYKRNK